MLVKFLIHACFLIRSDKFSVLRRNIPPNQVFTKVYLITPILFVTLVYENAPPYTLNYRNIILQDI